MNWVSNPKDFNDPFEFVMRSNYFLSEENKVIQLPLKQIEVKREIESEIDKLGVVCYSELEEEILMWSHYADGHRGMALVFDVENPIAKSIAKVNYIEQLPEMNFESDPRNIKSGLSQTIISKSKSWEYEKEWRQIISMKGKHIEYPGDLKEIIFGCKCPREDMEMVWGITEPIYNDTITYSRLMIQDDLYGFTKTYCPSHQNKKLKETHFFQNYGEAIHRSNLDLE